MTIARRLSMGLTAAFLATAAQAQVSTLWSASFRHPTFPSGAFDRAGNAVFGAAGEVYVGVYSEHPVWGGAQRESHLLAFDPSGAALWARALANSEGPFLPIVAYDAGNLYAAWSGTDASGQPVLVTARFDAAGNELWRFAQDLPVGVEHPREIWIGPGGTVTVVGSGNQGFGYFLCRRSSAGAWLWAHSGTSAFKRSVLDVQGNLYVACAGLAGAGPEMVMKVSDSGAIAWTRTPPGGDAYSVAVDAAGRVAVGSFESGPASTALYDSAGNLLWNQQSGYGLPSVGWASDGTLCTFAWSSNLDPGFVLLRYDTAGQLLSSAAGDVAAGSEVAFHLHAGSAGQVWVTGWVSSPSLVPFLIQFDAAGQPNWVHTEAPGAPPFPIFDTLSADRKLVRSHHAAGDALVVAYDLGDAPDSYCTPKTNHLGCASRLEFSGSPSAAGAQGFLLVAGEVLNHKSGLYFYGTGAAATPFQGAYLCVQPPLRRSIALTSGGTAPPASDCSGTFLLDVNAFASGALGGNPDPALRSVGTRWHWQEWSRDPAAISQSSLSNALSYVVQP